MILKNSNGKEREFKILLKIEKDKEKYAIYKDYLTNNLYAGKIKKNKLVILTDEEYIYINNIYERIES